MSELSIGIPFTKAELSCPCGCGAVVTDILLRKLVSLRFALNQPLHVTSSARCVDYNLKIGGALGSLHLTGEAVDISCLDSDLRMKIVSVGFVVGFSFIEVADKHVHLDIRQGSPSLIAGISL